MVDSTLSWNSHTIYLRKKDHKGIANISKAAWQDLKSQSSNNVMVIHG